MANILSMAMALIAALASVECMINEQSAEIFTKWINQVKARGSGEAQAVRFALATTGNGALIGFDPKGLLYPLAYDKATYFFTFNLFMKTDEHDTGERKNLWPVALHGKNVELSFGMKARMDGAPGNWVPARVKKSEKEDFTIAVSATTGGDIKNDPKYAALVKAVEKQFNDDLKKALNAEIPTGAQ